MAGRVLKQRMRAAAFDQWIWSNASALAVGEWLGENGRGANEVGS